MKKETVKIVIVGHVDHGKSTLIGRLLLDTDSLPREKMAEIKKVSGNLGVESGLAYLTDQLREEREKNITIDTTQIFFRTRKRNYCIIDVPGHVEFLKNMISGASFASSAVLIVDVSAGVMEQTHRHAYILDMLGIKNLVVVFNKMDIVGYDKEVFEKVKLELSDFLKALSMKPAFIIPISAKKGTNILRRSPEMRWYKGPSFLEALDKLKIEADMRVRPLRFPVQDIYEIDGEVILVGKVASGSARTGEKVLIFPGRKEARIRKIKVFRKNKVIAREGENIGLVLDTPVSVKRGDIISGRKEEPSLRNFFCGDIFWMSDKPLRKKDRFTLRCATQEVGCFIDRIKRKIDSSTLEILEEDAGDLGLNEAGVVTLKTEKPLALEEFGFIEELGRFVIEENHVVRAVGIVTGLE